MSYKVQILFIVFITAEILTIAKAQTCPEFDEIPEDQYDRNYSSILDGNARPLGFKKAVYYFNDNEKEEPCFTVKGAATRHIEIMFETFPESVLCIRDSKGLDVCAEGRFVDCRRAEAAEITYTFYCDISQGCSESDVTFWLRLTKGPLQEDDSEEMWCDNRNRDYPEDLAPLPSGLVPAPTPTISRAPNSLLLNNNLFVFTLLFVLLIKLS